MSTDEQTDKVYKAAVAFNKEHKPGDALLVKDSFGNQIRVIMNAPARVLGMQVMIAILDHPGFVFLEQIISGL